MKKKLIYWLTQEMSSMVQQRIQLLAKEHIEVAVFRSYQQILDEYAKIRTNMIILSDEGSVDEIEVWIRKFSLNPEFKGTRFVFSVMNPTPRLMKLAYDNDFKDIIPADLAADRWLQRFLFSMATAPAQFKQPMPQITLKEEAQIAIPAKIVWVAPMSMRIETRIRAHAGDTIALAGPFAAKLGVKSLQIKVSETVKTDLFYRFSEGMVCSVELAGSQMQARYNLLLEHLHKQDRGLACKAFLIIKNPETRKAMLDQLRDPRFEPLSAINQKSIITEPRYFNPDIVFIESELFTMDHTAMFKKMIMELKKDTPIVFIGKGNKEEISAFGNQIRNKIFQLGTVGPDLADSILDKFLLQKRFTLVDAPQDAIIVGKDNEFATAEIMLPATLQRIHPDFATMVVHKHLGNYGLCRVESEYLRAAVKAPVFGKLIGTFHIPKEAAVLGSDDSYLVELNLSCLSHEKELIGESMLHTIMRYMKNLSEIGLHADLSGTIAIRRDDEPPIGPAARIDVAAMKSSAFTSDEDEGMKPIDVLADMVGRGTQEVLRTVKSPRVVSWLNLIGIVLLFSAFSAAALYGAYYYFEKIAATYHRSGKEYTNQLEKFREK